MLITAFLVTVIALLRKRFRPRDGSRKMPGWLVPATSMMGLALVAGGTTAFAHCWLAG